MSLNDNMHDMTEAHGHMLELIGNLEEKKMDNAEIIELKAKVDMLFGETFKDMTTLQQDLKTILISFKSGRLTTDQFERMIMSEAERSGFLVAMAEKLNKKLERLFEMMTTIIDAIECGDEISDTKISSLFLDMGNVMESVRSISNVVTTPSQAVSSSIMKLNHDLKKSDEKYHKEIEYINIIEEKRATGEFKHQEMKEIKKETLELNDQYNANDSIDDAGIRKPRMLQAGLTRKMSIRAHKSPSRETEDDNISVASSFRVNVRVEAGSQTQHTGPLPSQIERGIEERPRSTTPKKSKRKSEDHIPLTITHTIVTHTTTKTSSTEEENSLERMHTDADPTNFNDLKITGAMAALVFPKTSKDGNKSPQRRGSAQMNAQVVEQISKAAELKAVIDSSFLEEEIKRIKAIEESFQVKEASLDEREKAMNKKIKKMEKELQKRDKEIQRLTSYTKSPKNSVRKSIDEEVEKVLMEKPTIGVDISAKAILDNYEEEISTPVAKSLTVLGSSLKKDRLHKGDELINLSAPNTPGYPLKDERIMNHFDIVVPDGLQFQVPALNLIPEELVGRPQLKGSSVNDGPLTPDSLSASVSTFVGNYHTSLQVNAPQRNSDLILIHPPSVKDQMTSTDDIEKVLPPILKNDDFNDDIFDDPSRPTTGQLPLVSQIGSGLLAVRTYRNIPPRNFKVELKESKNPLLLLHDEYHDQLPNVFRARLMNAAVDDRSTKSLELAKSMFSSIIPTLEKIDNTCAVSLGEGEACDQIIDTLVLWLELKNYSVEKYNDALLSLFKKTGEIESLKLWADVQLVEYRSIFEKFNSSSIHCLPALLQKCSEFQKSYQLFLSCQGKSLDMMKRIEVIKARVSKYKLSKAQSVNMMMLQDKSFISNSNASFKIEEIIRLENTISKLQDELAFVEADRDELNLEVFRVMQEGDKTPGAFLFFAALHDQSTIKVFQQLTLQLNHIKGFAECNTYMDFATLRKRLLVCISTIPTVEKFVDKYAALYKKWTHRRLEAFTDRGMIGGVADEGHVCPMCSCDSRENNSLTVPKLKKTKELPKKNVEEHRLKARIAELVLEERIHSLSTLPGIQMSKSSNDLQVPRRSIVIKTPTASNVKTTSPL